MTDLFVNEMFGPTLQGEGPSIGEPATFLRLAGCNLQCVWCDTPYSWDWKRFDKAAESHRMTTAEVAQRLAVLRPPGDETLLVVTGGEPMLQQRGLAELFSAGNGPTFRVEMETAGTVAPTRAWDDMVFRYVVSPKLIHSGNDMTKATVPAALAALNDTGRVAWKFVCQTVDDLDEVEEYVAAFDLDGPVYIMPEGIDAATVLGHQRDLADEVVRRGWLMTTRLHILVWNTKRGV